MTSWFFAFFHFWWFRIMMALVHVTVGKSLPYSLSETSLWLFCIFIISQIIINHFNSLKIKNKGKKYVFVSKWFHFCNVNSSNCLVRDLILDKWTILESFSNHSQIVVSCSTLTLCFQMLGKYAKSSNLIGSRIHDAQNYGFQTPKKSNSVKIEPFLLNTCL